MFVSDSLVYIERDDIKVSMFQVHVTVVQQFVLASFDLARELQVVPKKIQYVAAQEQVLYEVRVFIFFTC